MSQTMSMCRCRVLFNVVNQDRRIFFRINHLATKSSRRQLQNSVADLTREPADNKSKKSSFDSLTIRMARKATECAHVGSNLNKDAARVLVGVNKNDRRKTDNDESSRSSSDLLKRLKEAAPKNIGLSRTVTKALEEDILAGAHQKRFLLRQVMAEIRQIEGRRHHLFTLPQSLSIEEWQTLISLDDSRSRQLYLQQVGAGTLDLEAIRAQDTVYQNPLHISEEMITESVGDDQEGRRRIKLFQMHHEVARQEGERVPYKLDDKTLCEIAQIGSTSGFKKLLAYMLKNEMRAFNNGLKRRDKEARLDEVKAASAARKAGLGAVSYGLGSNTIHLRFYKTTFNHTHDWNAIREFNGWGVPLVINMAHHETYRLKRPALKSLAAEIKNSIIVNKTSKTPFQLHVTDLTDSSTRLLEDYYDTSLRPEAPCNVTRESHLDLFAKERLVYLSPDSNQDLKRFNSDDVYVIGGIIDKTDEKKPITLSAAKRHRIRHARFPMRQNLGLTAELNVETCVAILNDLMATQDWFFSLRWVPSRVLANRCKTSSNLQHYLAYRAHRFLSPTGPMEEENFKNLLLNPAQYRFFYRRIMEARTEREVDDVIKNLQ